MEWKESISSAFLKTVSAFANFGTGKILFGVRNDGTAVGITNPEAACFDIENRINDSIQPKPDFSFSINRRTNVITLEVREGEFKPYLFKGKAYRRTDTASVVVDQVELKRLILEGENLSFEQLPSDKQNLTFEYLGGKFKDILDVDQFSTDILKTLGFYTKKAKLNHAAALLADKNIFSGIDIIRFGKSINEIMERATFSNQSVLKAYDSAIRMFEQYYTYEKIDGLERKKVEPIPAAAFREALANAVVHRVWDIPSYIRIAMHPDQIELYSPGGLPIGMNENEYLEGYISRLRNPIVANVFFRLHLIEVFGTGIRRIRDCYAGSEVQPKFHISENSIRVILPTTGKKREMTTDEETVLRSLSSGIRLSCSEMVSKTGFSKNKVLRLVNLLLEKDYLRKFGNGRGTKYGL